MRVAVVLICFTLTAAACGGTPGQGPGDEEILIAAAPWPLEWLAAQVAPAARIEGLGQSGQDAHELDLRPAERELLERADAVLHIGPVGFQPQVEDAVKGRPDVGVAVTQAAEKFLLTTAGHAEHRDHGASAGDGEHAEVDPHLWFDVRTLAAAAPVLARRLGEADPGRAGQYLRNATAIARELESLHGELDALLNGCEQDAVVVGHEAFAYLLSPRGLEQIGISGVGGHGEASPARMAELAELIGKHGIGAVLSEPVEGREAAESLARETGAVLRVVDTLEAPALAARERGYPALLREQAAVFAEALECAA